MSTLNICAWVRPQGGGRFNGLVQFTCDSNPLGHTDELYLPHAQPKRTAGHQPISSRRLAKWERIERCYQALSQLDNLKGMGPIPKHLLVEEVLERNGRVSRGPEK